MRHRRPASAVIIAVLAAAAFCSRSGPAKVRVTLKVPAAAGRDLPPAGREFAFFREDILEGWARIKGDYQARSAEALSRIEKELADGIAARGADSRKALEAEAGRRADAVIDGTFREVKAAFFEMFDRSLAAAARIDAAGEATVELAPGRYYVFGRIPDDGVRLAWSLPVRVARRGGAIVLGAGDALPSGDQRFEEVLSILDLR